MIYFLRLPDQTIKIGFSSQVRSRISSLKCTYGGGEIMGVMAGDRTTEQATHAVFDNDRIGRSERFHESPEILDFIRSATVQFDEILHDGRKCVNIRLDPDVRQLLRNRWAATGVNQSDTVNDAVRQLLAGQKPPKPAA